MQLPAFIMNAKEFLNLFSQTIWAKKNALIIHKITTLNNWNDKIFYDLQGNFLFCPSSYFLRKNTTYVALNKQRWYLNHVFILLLSKLHYITSGGGSKAWRNVFKKNEDTVRFFYDGQGFMSLEVSETEAKFVFYDAFGNVLYKWCTAKATDQLRHSF